ncbi:ABC transporter permease subunit [Streptomyces sp. TRM43335]|uniref:ABC transporter permease subunit n=1 Tax=Streptomyces taklimakanensis TaxID=2569853 RepID=A0A6G2BGP2_9ACTN|nr:ABC transporter permease subunit [Streptomyces taklimakanensis]MTE21239.1 ABC transporter permease subunit [Streptomyces taklimakanensis]
MAPAPHIAPAAPAGSPTADGTPSNAPPPDDGRRPGPRRGRRKGRKAAAPPGGITWRHRLRRDRALVLMTAPALLLVLVFAYVPLLGNAVAFKEFDPYVGESFFESFELSPWVGFEQFQRMWDDPYFWGAVENTLVIFLIQLVFFFPIPILLALLINSIISPRVRAWAQGVLYLPHFFSWVLVITVFQQIFGGAGIIAQTMRDHGGGGFDLMTDPDFFKFLVTFQMIWKDAGWGIIVFLAALAAVNHELYEAAAMDGANRWRRMWHVTLPALRPVIAMLLVLRVGDALTVGFEQILLQRRAVGTGASEVLDTYVWNVGLENGDFGYAAAVGVVKGIFGLCLVLIANKTAHLLGEQGVYKK